MGIRDKIILASVVVRGVAAFGLAFYTLANFARWYVEESEKLKKSKQLRASAIL